MDKYRDILNTEPLGDHEIAILRDYFGSRFAHDQSNAAEDTIQTCTICFEAFKIADEVIRFPQCQHQYHWPCLQNWLVQHLNCPLCKRDLRPAMIVVVREHYQTYAKLAEQKRVTANHTADLSQHQRSTDHA